MLVTLLAVKSIAFAEVKLQVSAIAVYEVVEQFVEPVEQGVMLVEFV